MGGKPNQGTDKDKRLHENKRSSTPAKKSTSSSAKKPVPVKRTATRTATRRT